MLVIQNFAVLQKDIPAPDRTTLSNPWMRFCYYLFWRIMVRRCYFVRRMPYSAIYLREASSQLQFIYSLFYSI